MGNKVQFYGTFSNGLNGEVSVIEIIEKWAVSGENCSVIKDDLEQAGADTWLGNIGFNTLHRPSIGLWQVRGIADPDEDMMNYRNIEFAYSSVEYSNFNQAEESTHLF